MQYGAFYCTRCACKYREPCHEYNGKLIPDISICQGCRDKDKDKDNKVQALKVQVAMEAVDGFQLLMAEVCAIRDSYIGRMLIAEDHYWQRVLENIRKLKEDKDDGKADSRSHQLHDPERTNRFTR